MAEQSEPREAGVRLAGTNLELIRELMKNPVYGFFVLIVIVVEGALFTAFLKGETATERFVALGLFGTLILAVLLFFAIERKRSYALERAKLAPAPVPPSMVAEPIQEEAIKRESDLHTAPDGTFVYSKPPDSWLVSFSSFEDLALEELKRQRMERLDESRRMPFRAGTLVHFSSRDSTIVKFLPGKSLLNGRAVIGGMSERAESRVVMFSVSKRGGMLRDITAEHVFSHVLAGLLAMGYLIEDIRDAISAIGQRTTLSARGTKRFANVIIDNMPSAAVSTETWLHVVEHENFVYVVQTMVIDGALASSRWRTEIEEIVSSFRVSSAANAAERELKDVQEADAAFDVLMTEGAAGILALKAQSVAGEIQNAEGSIHISEEQLDSIRTLEAYAISFPQYVDEAFRSHLTAFRAAAEKAFAGDDSAIRELLNEGTGTQ